MRTTRRRVFVSMAAAATAGILLAGCAGGSPESTEDEQSTLTLGMTADLTGGWDIVDQPSFQSWGIEAVYDTLVKCEPGGGLSAAAAEEWEISDDKRSFTAHLREGMTYSDGSPVDAESVQRSFEVVQETASDRYGDVTFESPDDQTIIISWPDPQPVIDLRVCAPYLASIAYIDSGDRKTEPVGSGPYTYDAAASTAGSVYKLTRNPDFYNADAYPYETLELRVLTDETAAINALKTGQIDGTVIGQTVYDEAKNAGLDLIEQEGGMLMIHLTDRLGEKIPALADARVRQAMNMVLDKQSIVDNLLGGFGNPIWQPFQEGTDAYLEDLEEPYPYDVEAAKKLMAEAGFEEGFSITVPTMEGQGFVTLLPYITQQFAELNITVEQQALSGPDAIAQLLSGDFPVPIWPVGGLTSIDDITIHILSTGYWNVMHQADPTVDALWQTILTGTEEESVQAQQEINQYVVDQAWFVPITSGTAIYAYNGDKVTIDEVSDPYRTHPKLIDFQ